MRVIPRKLVCCVLVAGIGFGTTEVETAFGQEPGGPLSPGKPSPASSTPGSAAVPMPEESVSKSTGMKLALIPAGTFEMGSSAADVKAAVQAVSNFNAGDRLKFFHDIDQASSDRRSPPVRQLSTAANPSPTITRSPPAFQARPVIGE